jgi:hypothetical protein
MCTCVAPGALCGIRATAGWEAPVLHGCMHVTWHDDPGGSLSYPLRGGLVRRVYGAVGGSSQPVLPVLFLHEAFVSLQYVLRYMCLNVPTWWRGAGSIHDEMRQDKVSRVVRQVCRGEQLTRLNVPEMLFCLPEAFHSLCQHS